MRFYAAKHVKKLWLAAAVAVLIAIIGFTLYRIGVFGYTLLPYETGQEGGNATLSLGGTTIIFEGIPATAGDILKGGRGSGWGFNFGVESQNSAHGLPFKERYAFGVRQFWWGDYSFKVTENGRKLVFGEQTFAVGEKTIWVAKDGKAREDKRGRESN